MVLIPLLMNIESLINNCGIADIIIDIIAPIKMDHNTWTIKHIRQTACHFVTEPLDAFNLSIKEKLGIGCVSYPSFLAE